MDLSKLTIGKIELLYDIVKAGSIAKYAEGVEREPKAVHDEVRTAENIL